MKKRSPAFLKGEYFDFYIFQMAENLKNLFHKRMDLSQKWHGKILCENFFFRPKSFERLKNIDDPFKKASPE